MPNLHIRDAVTEDAAAIHQFIVELAVYEKAGHEVKASIEEVRTSLFEEPSTTRALIIELDQQAIGYAVFFSHYSTWLGNHGIYLEDLYITPEQRGIGAGKALLQHIAKIATDNHCLRMEWSVLDWNEPAIQFYQSIGAEPQNEWIKYRLDGEALRKFAAD